VKSSSRPDSTEGSAASRPQKSLAEEKGRLGGVADGCRTVVCQKVSAKEKGARRTTSLISENHFNERGVWGKEKRVHGTKQ